MMSARPPSGFITIFPTRCRTITISSRNLETLGKDRICQIHCTDQDGVWLQDDPKINMPKVKETLDKMGWSGWLVIERSRKASDSRQCEGQFLARTRGI